MLELNSSDRWLDHLPELPWLSEALGSGYRFPYCLKDAFDIPYQLRRVKWFFQRARRGWADKDLWDVGSYITRVEAEMLDAFINMYDGPRGLPGLLCDHKGNCSQWDLHQIEWTNILTTMRDGMRAAEHLSIDCDCIDTSLGQAEYRKAFGAHEKKYRAIWCRAHVLRSRWILGVWD